MWKLIAIIILVGIVVGWYMKNRSRDEPKPRDY